jgi:hypothetical protein
MKTFAFRVYFTVAPDTYYVVSARNARVAVWRAKRSQRAFRLNKRRTAPLRVVKIERITRSADGITRAVPLRLRAALSRAGEDRGNGIR